jgi:hypothetical protein
MPVTKSALKVTVVCGFYVCIFYHIHIYINSFMRKKIAIMLCGLCNTNPKNFDAVFGVFERLSSMYDIDIDYYMHLWTNERRFPENFDGDEEIRFNSYYEYLPTEDISLQEKVIKRISPKSIIYSDFSETADNSYYVDYPAYISYVNTLGQFYAVEKIVNSCDLSNYDLILRWRYDLVVNHHDFISEISNVIMNIDQSKKNFITKDFHIIAGGYNKIGSNDRWFGFTPSGLNDFTNMHEILFINTGGAERKLIWVEEGFYNFVVGRQFERTIVNFEERVLRKNMIVTENYTDMNRDGQQEELQNFSMWIGPEHANNGYHPN